MHESSSDGARLGSEVRGWLSEQLVPALLEGRADELVKRFGARGTLDDAVGGRAAGLAAVAGALDRLGHALRALGARWEPFRFTWGTERDVSEGVLTLPEALGGGALPFAAVAERRRAREIEIRTYYDPRRLSAPPVPRGAAGRSRPLPSLPPQAQVLVDALRRADAASAEVLFETHASLTPPDGVLRRGRAELAQQLGALFATPGTVDPLSVTDDGRATVLELAVRTPQEPSLRPVLAVLERGDTGLVRELALYGRLEVGGAAGT